MHTLLLVRESPDVGDPQGASEVSPNGWPGHGNSKRQILDGHTRKLGGFFELLFDSLRNCREEIHVGWILAKYLVNIRVISMSDSDSQPALRNVSQYFVRH